MAVNRVYQLTELWGHEQGLQIARSNHRRAHTQGAWYDAQQWLLEIEAYRSAKIIPFRPTEAIRFRPPGPAKVLAFR